jgi:hypothetical protein
MPLAAAGVGMAAALAYVPAGAGADEVCAEGSMSQAAVSPDADGDGAVCVDPATGALQDDDGFVGRSPLEVDLNGNGVVCFRPEPGVFIDDPGGDQECPPGFEPVLAV